eukprot:10805894-Alexandrium_andersonii.AAC.1
MRASSIGSATTGAGGVGCPRGMLGWVPAREGSEAEALAQRAAFCQLASPEHGVQGTVQWPSRGRCADCAGQQL